MFTSDFRPWLKNVACLSSLLSLGHGDFTNQTGFSGFQMTAEKAKPKQLLRPITTGADSAMNQSQFLAITCNSLKAREKSRVQGAIALGFASHWLKSWREFFKPITKRSNRNQVITFDSHLKTTLNQ